MGFNKFKELFDNTYDSIYIFIDDWCRKNEVEEDCPFEFEVVENLDQQNYDSYGNEDSNLRRIYYIKDFDIYVEFYGTRQSYSGEEWNGYKEVIKTTKTVEVWT